MRVVIHILTDVTEEMASRELEELVALSWNIIGILSASTHFFPLLIDFFMRPVVVKAAMLSKLIVAKNERLLE